MTIKIIFTLVVAFLLVLFGVFNPESLKFSLFGIRDIESPLSFFVFMVFLAGGIFAGILSFADQVKQSMRIRKLKRKIKDLKDEVEENIQNGQSHSPGGGNDIPREGLEEENEDNDSGLTSVERDIALRKIEEQRKKTQNKG